MLIDSFVPRYDAFERHQVSVEASRSDAYAAVRDLDAARSPTIAALLAIRAVPHLLGRKLRVSRRLTVDFLLEAGFVILAEEPGVELVLGVAGRFWRLDSGVERISAEEFVGFDEPGFAKAAWNFRVEEEGPGRSRIVTETRVVCTDARARRRFSVYWKVVGPFSALIRRRLLAGIKKDAERRGRTGAPG